MKMKPGAQAVRQTHIPKPVYVTFLNELRSTHWNLLPRGEIQEKKMLPVMATNSQTSY